MIEVRIGRERSLNVIRIAWGHLHEYERDRTSTATRDQLDAAGGYRKLFGRPPIFRLEDHVSDAEMPFGVEVLTDEIVAWLNERALGWQLIERKHFPRSLAEAVYETVLRLRDRQTADDFSSVWAGYLHAREVACLNHERAQLRDWADICFEWLRNAQERLRYRRAREYVDAERSVRRADGELRRIECEFRERQHKSAYGTASAPPSATPGQTFDR